MARPPRIEYPDALYHVLARGNQRREIFHDDADRSKYLAKLAAYKQRHGFALYAYVLMTKDRKSTRLNSSHIQKSRMPSSA